MGFLVYDGNGLHQCSLGEKRDSYSFTRRILGFPSTYSDIAVDYFGVVQIVHQAHSVSQIDEDRKD